VARIKGFLAGLAIVVLGIATLGGCASHIAVGADTVVVDVRTPAEYAAGHLDGARNIDVESAAFEGQVAQLDPHGHYVVYCHSGNRAAAAVGYMKGHGFSDVRNAGGIDAASAKTGLRVVS
jgi:phage shock protein E